tara:strand:- start:1191 stop:1382 length:192 start_codon:yes stop_codon:yes gene_type:complete
MKCYHEEWEYVDEEHWGFSQDEECAGNCMTYRVTVICADCGTKGYYIRDTCLCPTIIDWEDSQ